MKKVNRMIAIMLSVLLLAAGLFCAGDVMLIMPSGLLLVLALLKKAV